MNMVNYVVIISICLAILIISTILKCWKFRLLLSLMCTSAMSQKALTFHAYEAESSLRPFQECGWCKQGELGFTRQRHVWQQSLELFRAQRLSNILSLAEKAENNCFSCSREFWAVHLHSSSANTLYWCFKHQKINGENFSTHIIVWTDLTTGAGVCCWKKPHASVDICSVYFNISVWHVSWFSGKCLCLIFTGVWPEIWFFSSSPQRNNQFDLERGRLYKSSVLPL